MTAPAVKMETAEKTLSGVFRDHIQVQAISGVRAANANQDVASKSGPAAIIPTERPSNNMTIGRRSILGNDQLLDSGKAGTGLLEHIVNEPRQKIAERVVPVINYR